MLRFFTERRTLCLGHRGASSLAPENTLAAAELAADLGADGWEVDVRCSGDGVPVLVHDATLERTTDVALRSQWADRNPWPLDAFTWPELQELDAGTWFSASDPFGQRAAGAALSAERCARQRILSLRQCLEFTLQRDLLVNVELKPPGKREGAQAPAILARAVTSQVLESGAAHCCLLSSFDAALLALCRDMAPDVPRALLLAEHQEPLATLLQRLRGLEAAGVHPGRDMLGDEEIAVLRQKGLLVNVWTVDDEAEMRRLQRLGVSGVISNFVQRCPFA